jgi:hypothetical protein
MKTLYVFCEGKTEQGFCEQLLAPHLFAVGFTHVPTIRVAQSRSRGVVHRGGVTTYEPLRRDIQNTLKSRSDDRVYFTSMLDLYGLPKNFPGKADTVRDPDHPDRYVEALERALGHDIGDARFVPHLQLHEYETLLYAEPEAFAIAFENCDRMIAGLRAVISRFPSIEHINDGENTAPSKRIIDLLPEYEGRKTTAGPDIAEYIGLPRLRAACPHFDQWMATLETLGG